MAHPEEIEPTRCPIWNTRAEVKKLNKEALQVCSPRAGGGYVIRTAMLHAVGKLSEDQKVLLTSWLVKERSMGNKVPTVPDQPEHVLGNTPSVYQRALDLLLYIHSCTPRISDFIGIKIYGSLYPNQNPSWNDDAQMLAWSASTERDELLYLLQFLEEQGWLRKINSPNPEYLAYTLTVKGHNEIDSIKRPTADSTQVFVAMWFSPKLKDAYEQGIEPAIRSSGYTAMRIDKEHHLDKIDDKIIVEIRRSKFMVADLTQGADGVRGSVYYEIGFAHGLNIPVIFTCRKDSIDKIHFDIRQYPAIPWNDVTELRENLENRIAAVIRDSTERA